MKAAPEQDPCLLCSPSTLDDAQHITNIQFFVLCIHYIHTIYTHTIYTILCIHYINHVYHYYLKACNEIFKQDFGNLDLIKAAETECPHFV